MAWYSSWMPGLPNFNLSIPASIQGRFISFLLKKSLGHLLNPGQLDYRQIDSQIGSGYVQVNDLQLNPEAVNGYLIGLPLKLQDGVLSSVKVRIPWPNPLASTLGFSLSSVHLTFCVAPISATGERPDVDLTDSVASVAESFIHQELSEREEATLWKSLYNAPIFDPENKEESVPGGLDTSPNATDFPKFDTDPAGISVFAGLIERLLARFEFDAHDIKITLIHPENISLTLSLKEIQYRTDAAGAIRTDGSIESRELEGERHTLSMNGILVSSCNIAAQMVVSSFSTSTASPAYSSSGAPFRPPSRATSDESMDEEVDFAMSQSLASLPPRSTSPPGSTTSSMYQSAISNISSSNPALGPEETQPIYEHREETMVSFGNQPIILEVVTPSSAAPSTEDDPFISSFSPGTPPEDQLQIVLSIGVVGLVIRPWQISSLLRLTGAIIPREEQRKTKVNAKTSTAGTVPSILASADVRAAVFLLISTESNECRSISTQEFFARPLIPPKMDTGYTRIVLDSISFSSSMPPHVPKGESKTTSLMKLELQLVDFSIFFFSKPTNDLNSGLSAFPLLITDPNLPLQYTRNHIHRQNGHLHASFPNFEIINWTRANSQYAGARLSHWRCQPFRTNASDSSHPEQDISLTGNSLKPALKIIAKRSITTGGGNSSAPQSFDDLDIDISPLHVRLDLQHILQPDGPLSFLEDLLHFGLTIDDEGSFTSDTTVDRSLFATDRLRPVTNNNSPRNIDKEIRSQYSLTVINFHVIRLSVCCPSSPHLGSRSGTLIMDLHGATISLGSKPSQPSTRFADSNNSPIQEWSISDESIVLKTTFRRVVLACSMVNENTATAFVSIGPLADDNTQGTVAEDNAPPLLPCVLLIKPPPKKAGMAPALAFTIDIPSVLVDLSKPTFDSLQYWADDVTQLLERLSDPEKQMETSNSRDTSLIGSRFFTKSRSGSGSAWSSSRNEIAEKVIKFSITEAAITILAPRTDVGDCKPRPVYINASDLDILVELNPDHKQQTILTLGIMDLAVENISQDGSRQRFLSLTSPYSLSTSTKSILKLRFTTSTSEDTSSKETRIKLTLCGFTYTFFPDLHWISDLLAYAKNPPGTFESVIPSDRTRIFVKISDGSIRILAPVYPGALVSHMQELEFSTDVIDDCRDSSFHINSTGLTLLAIDDTQDQLQETRSARGVSFWTSSGYALLAEMPVLDTTVINQLTAHPLWKVLVDRIVLRLHLCADTLSALTIHIQDLGKLFQDPDDQPKVTNRRPTVVGDSDRGNTTIMSSVEDLAFKKVPEIGPAPDMIYDDLPSNLDYLDESFGAAGGLRELVDEDLEEFEDREPQAQAHLYNSYLVSSVGGETVKLFEPAGLDIVEDYYLSIPPDKSQGNSYPNDAILSVRVLSGTLNVFLYDGYDWLKTRKTIEEEIKEMRKRLAKIRQLVATGQMQQPIVEDTSTLLFNSVHIGLDQDEDGFEEPSALLAAIDEQLHDDTETASQSSWQTLHPSTSNKHRVRSTRVHGKKLTRSKAPSMEFSLAGVFAEFDQFNPNDPLVSRTFVTVKDLEILDHIKTSTWKKFLTELRSDSRGNIRETDSNMVRIELTGIRPVEGNLSEEARLRAKILPLRLYVDQDAVDFLKKFFSFKTSTSSDTSQPADEGETYIQLGEIFPVDLKLDYKPRRVDYRALKEGRTIELMNFFHFDGAEMTLRHITLAGVTGWPRFFEMLNDLWTPDVKATQLAEVISGVAPIRSIVNVGSGVADLILLPIAQYKKDGRIVRGVQKGATAFVKSTAVEAIKMGAKLATGTQVILEQAEGILGGQFETPITAEPIQVAYGDELDIDDTEDDTPADLISKYAHQPTDLKEGMQFAYKSLRRNLNSAAQTILAVPMEVYERSGNEGPVRSVIRAVPIAVLKPMIGASEAVSKTLLGLHNTLDPNIHHDNEAKYKLR